MSVSETNKTTAAGLRWGVLSTGSIANDFSLALRATEGAQLQAVGSRGLESAQAFQKQHGFKTAYDSYDRLVADPEVDIIYIATPHTFHAANIELCLNAGKHVLCEKPLCVNAAQAERCIDMARQKGDSLCC